MAPIPDIDINRTHEIVARRDRSFGADVRSYAEDRPYYPVAAIEWALAPLSAHRKETPHSIVCLGAGTGQLTRELLRAGHDVIAMEPDTAILRDLREQVPDAAAIQGYPENIPLPDRSADAVLAAASPHWFDLENAMPEIVRVLRPGGVFAALRNYDDDRVGWVSGYCDHLGPGSRITLADQSFDAAQHGPFGETKENRFPHVHRRNASTLTEAADTTSLNYTSEAERTAKLAAIHSYLLSHADTSSGEFDHPVVTLVLRAQLIENA